jgi:predicted RNase H-like HicB family nuclease
VVILKVPGVVGFFAQLDSFEDARANLKGVIECNIRLALQLGLEIQCLERVEIDISREKWINARSDMWRNSKNKNYCSSL